MATINVDVDDTYRPAFLKTVQDERATWQAARDQTHHEAIERAVAAFVEQRTATQGFCEPVLAKQHRYGLEQQALKAEEAARARFTDAHKAALATIEEAEQSSETLVPIDRTPELQDTADTYRFAAATLESQQMDLTIRFLRGGSTHDVLTAYQTAIATKDRATLRAIELAADHGLRIFELQAAPTEDVPAQFALQALIKQTRQARHPKWCAGTRAELKKTLSVQEDALLRLAHSHPI